MNTEQTTQPIKNEYIEQLAAKVHDSWWEEKKKQGFHAPIDCLSENKKSYDKAPQNYGKDKFQDLHDPKTYKWCEKCHPDMYPYEELPENVKEYDRVTVRTVLKAQEELKLSDTWNIEAQKALNFKETVKRAFENYDNILAQDIMSADPREDKRLWQNGGQFLESNT